MDLCADLMTAEPIRVSAATPLVECAKDMARLGFRHLPVVDADGRPLGMLHDHELFERGALTEGLQAWIQFRPDDTATTALDLMRAADVRSTPEQPVLPVLRRMLANHQDAALIVDQHGRLVGLITEHDAIRLALTIPRHLRVDDHGTRAPVALPANTPADQAWADIKDARIRHLLVTDEDRVIGVVSHRDFVNAAVPTGKRPILLGELLQPRPLVSAPMGTPLAEIARVMIRGHLGCVPIVDRQHHALRIVTRSDLIRTVADLS